MLRWVKYRSDPSTTTAKAVSAQDDYHQRHPEGETEGFESRDLTLVGQSMGDFICNSQVLGGYTRSTTEPYISFAQGDCSWEDFAAFGCGTWKVPLQGRIGNNVVARQEAEGRECSIEVGGSKMLPLWCICIGKVYRGYTRSTTEPCGAFDQGDGSWKRVTVAFGCGTWKVPLQV